MADATFDLVIAGGRVIDPAQGLDGRFDVAISGDRIAAGDRRLLFDAGDVATQR